MKIKYENTTKAIRNAGKVINMNTIKINKVCSKLKNNRLKTRTTHSQTVLLNVRQKTPQFCYMNLFLYFWDIIKQYGIKWDI